MPKLHSNAGLPLFSRDFFIMETLKIYALVCPVSNTVRYIGRTKLTITERLYHHIKSRQSKCNAQKVHWIKGLNENNLTPSIVLLEETNDLKDSTLEKKWIQHYLNLKNDLLNINT